MSSYLVSGNNIDTREAKISEIITSFLGNDYHKSIDLKIIDLEDGKKNISIDQIRSIDDFMASRPIEKEFKIVLIKNADSLSVEAQNAMLKILEEPPIYFKFILEASRSKSLLKTVLSRCITFELGAQEIVVIDSSEHSASVEDFVKLIVKDLGGRMDWVSENKDLFKEGDTYLNRLHSWESMLRDVLFFKNKVDGLYKNVFHLDGIERVAGLFSSSVEVEESLRRILRAKSAAKSNVNKSLIIEDFIVHLPFNQNAK